MVRLGTMRNGVIVPDEPDAIPEGARVALDLTADDEEGAWPADAPLPPYPAETREEFLASLREDIVAIHAGERGLPVAEAFARIRADLAFPPRRAGVSMSHTVVL